MAERSTGPVQDRALHHKHHDHRSDHPRQRGDGRVMIVKRGNRYLVKTHDGKRVLGEHGTYAEAQAQLAAIERSKRRRGRA